MNVYENWQVKEHVARKDADIYKGYLLDPLYKMGLPYKAAGNENKHQSNKVYKDMW